MNWEAITAIAEVIGLAAVVVSLLYLGFQVRQNTLQLRHDNMRELIRGTLDINWYYHRDSEAFDVFKRGVHSFHDLKPKDKAHFHSIVVDLAFYFEVVRNMAETGLIDPQAVETNQRFLGGVLVTPGGRQWLDFARKTQPMPSSALSYLESVIDSEDSEILPITELQPWFAKEDEQQ